MDGGPSSSEDDVSGSLQGFAVSLQDHSAEVEAKAELFAARAGLSAARTADLKLAGRLHDIGKTDTRFQRWLHYGVSSRAGSQTRACQIGTSAAAGRAPHLQSS